MPPLFRFFPPIDVHLPPPIYCSLLLSLFSLSLSLSTISLSRYFSPLLLLPPSFFFVVCFISFFFFPHSLRLQGDRYASTRMVITLAAIRFNSTSRAYAARFVTPLLLICVIFRIGLYIRGNKIRRHRAGGNPSQSDNARARYASPIDAYHTYYIYTRAINLIIR